MAWAARGWRFAKQHRGGKNHHTAAEGISQTAGGEDGGGGGGVDEVVFGKPSRAGVSREFL